jgi:hypothetical protein
MTRAQGNQEKTCTECGETKLVSEFDTTGYIRADGTPGHKKYCQDCRRKSRKQRYSEDEEFRTTIAKYGTAFRKANPEVMAERGHRYYEANKQALSDKGKIYREENREAIAERLALRRAAHPDRFREWAKTDYDKNRGAYIFRARVRLRIEKEARPSWFDSGLVEAKYREARQRTLDTGIQHVVDHIVPLQGELVRGLHVQDNLRVITFQENAVKSNSLVDDIV